MLPYHDDVTDGREQDKKGICLYPREALLKYSKHTSKSHLTYPGLTAKYSVTAQQEH